MTRIRPFGAVCAPADAGRRTFEVFENAQRRFVKVTACLGQRNGTGGAVHQFGAEFLFQGGDLFADRRLPDSQLPRNGGETPSFHHPDEYPHCVELIHSGLPIPCGMSMPAAAGQLDHSRRE